MLQGSLVGRTLASGEQVPSSAITMLVDAYERLGSRVLGRIRDLRGDVDADLTELRSQVASLRTAVEDVADRVQLRQVRSALDELRSDVAGLRQAVLEGPELERVAGDIATPRSARGAPPEEGRGVAVSSEDGGIGPQVVEAVQSALAKGSLTGLAPIAAEVKALRLGLADLADRVSVDQASPPDGTAGLDVLGRELADLRAEMVALRRRISLKAAGTNLTPEELAAIAEAVTERLLKSFRPA